MGALTINLYGGPGVGKSTTSAGVFSLLKLHDVECELITEFAKDLVWEERYKTFGDQQYIFGKQHHRMWRVKDKVGVMITDSPLMLSTIYNYNTSSRHFINSVVDTVNSFNNLNVVLVRTKKYNQNGRNETEDQAREIDNIVKKRLTEFNMDWIEIPGNFEGINQITKRVLFELGIKSMKFGLELFGDP